MLFMIMTMSVTLMWGITINKGSVFCVLMRAHKIFLSLNTSLYILSYFSPFCHKGVYYVLGEKIDLNTKLVKLLGAKIESSHSSDMF